MAASFSLFPVLNDNLRSQIRFSKTQYSMYYTDPSHRKQPLVIEDNGGGNLVYSLIDDNGIWTPDSYNIGISGKYYLSSCQCLFGENGIVCSNALPGLALRWTSSDSKQRGVIKIGDINNSPGEKEFSFDYIFHKGQLRGKISFELLIYLKKPGMPAREEEFLANESGTVLGSLDAFSIMLDGNGSAFPVYESSESGGPLWRVVCEWEDPSYDQFSESVSIIINTAHKSYKYLDRNKKNTFNAQLLNEVIAAALSIVIAKLREQNDYWNELGKDGAGAEGSVLEAISYFNETLGWDLTTPEKTSLSIRKFFEQRI